MKSYICKRIVLSVTVLACFVLYDKIGHAQEVQAQQDNVDKTKTDIHFSIYALASPAHHRSGPIGGNENVATSFGTGLGGGYKIGFFPVWTHRMVGLEVDASGLSAAVTVAKTSRDETTSTAHTNVIVVNTLVNLLIRYPGHKWQPYVGVGGGISSGYLRDTGIRHGIEGLTGYVSDLTYAYQFLGGLRGYVSHKVYMFAEYKYFIANYRWDNASSATPGLSTVLNFHTHLFSMGIGLSF